MTDQQLIYIFSQPRSGSTLLQALLSNTDLISTVSEPWLLLNFMNSFKPELYSAKFDLDAAESAFKEYHSMFFSKSELCSIYKDFFLRLYHPILVGNARYVLDKTPRYYEIISEIKEVLPHSKKIFLFRNPLSILNSVIQYGNASCKSDLFWWGRDLILGPERLLTGISEKDLKVYYEDLVISPSDQLDKILLYLEIDGVEIDLDFRNNKKFAGSFGDSNIVVNTKVHEKSTDNWKSLLHYSSWKGFAEGYIYYLLNNSLLDSKYSYLEEYAKKNSDFEFFKNCVSNDVNNIMIPSSNFKLYLEFRIKKFLKW